MPNETEDGAGNTSMMAYVQMTGLRCNNRLTASIDTQTETGRVQGLHRAEYGVAGLWFVCCVRNQRVPGRQVRAPSQASSERPESQAEKHPAPRLTVHREGSNVMARPATSGRPNDRSQRRRGDVSSGQGVGGRDYTVDGVAMLQK